MQLFVLFTVSVSMAQDLNIKTKTEGIISYSIADIKKISFVNDSLIISHHDSSDIIFGFLDVSFLYFNDRIVPEKPNKFEDTLFSLTVYPNPFENELHIQFHQFPVIKFVVEIYSMEGNCVYRNEKKSGQDVFHIDVSHLASGIYFIKICSNDSCFIKQLSKSVNSIIE